MNHLSQVEVNQVDLAEMVVKNAGLHLKRLGLPDLPIARARTELLKSDEVEPIAQAVPQTGASAISAVQATISPFRLEPDELIHHLLR